MRVERALPAVDQLEVSLFGPGYGECVACHLGDGKWMIADSCVDQRSNTQPALRYLESLGLEPAAAVRYVVVTHWHTDHIRGMADVVAACPDAEIWMSAALLTKEVQTLVSLDGNDLVQTRNPYREMYRVQQAIETRSAGLGGSRVLNQARSNQIVHRELGPVAAEVVALSPSAVDAAATVDRFRALLGRTSNERRAAKEQRPNATSVVLSVQVDGHAALLGSDLEQESSANSGWKAIVSSHAGQLPAASVYKVAHHGSATGHNADVWDLLLAAKPLSILSPFRQSHLPRPEDERRLLNLSGEVYATAAAKIPTQRRPTRRQDIALEQSVHEVIDTEGQAGHIQVRSPSRVATIPTWQVGLSDPARELT